MSAVYKYSTQYTVQYTSTVHCSCSNVNMIMQYCIVYVNTVKSKDIGEIIEYCRYRAAKGGEFH